MAVLSLMAGEDIPVPMAVDLTGDPDPDVVSAQGPAQPTAGAAGPDVSIDDLEAAL